jgi:tetratricopeptide (TPR) repeat protein
MCGLPTNRMSRSAKAIILSLSVVFFSGLQTGFGQAPDPAQAPDKSGAYFNFSMGHLYAELAAAMGNRGDSFGKAVDYYKQALKLDPSATFVLEELTDLYVQGNQLRAAVAEAEELLKKNPDNLQARRMLGRIYTRSIGDTQQGKVNEEMVHKAIEQYQIITTKDPTDMDSWLTLGRLQRVAQNSVEAEKAFKKALERDPSNEDALTGLALVYSDVGDTKNMIDMLKQVTDRSPNERSLATLGQAYEQMHDYANAADVFRKALELRPDSLPIKRALAQDLLSSGHEDEALKQYEELAQADEKDAVAPLRMSEIYRQKKMYDKAGAALAKARQIDGDNIEVRYEEVNLLDAEGKTDEAIKKLRGYLDETVKKTYTGSDKSTRIMLLERLSALYRDSRQVKPAVDALREINSVDPDVGPRVEASIVETYRGAKDFKAALAEAEAAEKKYPKDRTVILEHASLTAEMGKVDQAAAEVKSLLNGGDKDRETYVRLAEVYEKGKNYSEMGKALDQAEKLSESKQDKELVHFMRGAMLERQKKYGPAEAEFRKVLEINPQNDGALNYLGYMLADRGERLEEARDLIRKALEIQPDNGAYLDSMGWVNFRLNKLDEAERNLRESIEKINGDATVYDHLGDVYLKQGKIKDAIAQWQLSLTEWDKSSKAEVDSDEVAKVTKKLEGARVRLARESSGGSSKQQ